MKRLLLTSILTIFLLCIGLRAGETSAEQIGKKNYSANFWENKGQIIDQFGDFRPDVKFLFASPGFKLQLRDNGFSYELYSMEQSDREKVKDLKRGREESAVPGVINYHRVDVSLKGASPGEVVRSGKSRDYNNYYLAYMPESGITNVHHYREVTYKDIYNGIDLKFYTTGKEELGVKYDFIVSPGADATAIRLGYAGADRIAIENGALKIYTSQGEVIEQKPFAYYIEEGRTIEVPVAFVLHGSQLSFRVGEYDKSRTLIIDPTLVWSTYYGGTGNEYAYTCVNDNSGNLIGGGKTSTSASGNIIATSGAHQTNYGGANYTWQGDGFIVKFNSDGERQWGTYYGGSENDKVEDIHCIGSDIYACGYTESSSAIATSGAYQTAVSGGNDGFLAKFNSSGTRQWGTYYGGSLCDYFYGITGDGTYIYASGATSSTMSIASSGAHQTAYGGGSEDGFLVKFSGSGSRQWATYYGGSEYDYAYGMGNDGSNIIIGGYSESDNAIATSGAHQTANGGSGDGFVAKFNGSGTRQWGTYYGGGNWDSVNDVMCDSDDAVYIVGTTESSTGTGIATTGSHQDSYGGGTDAFFAKLSSSGSRQWGTYYGGTSSDRAAGVDVDGDDYIYFIGTTNSWNNIATNDGYQTSIGGSWSDAFWAKFNSSGSRQYATYFGGYEFEYGYDICIYDLRNVYFCGMTESWDMPVQNAHQSTWGDGNDAFFAKLGIGITTQDFADTEYCAPEDIDIVFEASDDFNSGNIFTAQLSDETGDFSNAISLGTLASTSAGSHTINGSIPSYIDYGTGYRIRVVGSSPSVNGTDNGTDLIMGPAPVPSVNGVTELCAGTSGEEFISSEEGDSYSWSVFDDEGNWVSSDEIALVNSMSRTVTMNVSSTVSGTYTLDLMIAYDHGGGTLYCDRIVSHEFVVNPLPDPVISGSHAVCMNSGNTYEYVVGGDFSASSISWSIYSGGTIVGGQGSRTVTVEFEEQGMSEGNSSLKVGVTTEEGCWWYDDHSISRYATPDPDISGDLTACLYDEKTYTVDVPSTYTVSWYASGGTITSGQGSGTFCTVEWNSAGSNSLTCIVNNSICENSDEIVVEVTNPQPIIMGPTNVCESAMVEYYATNISTSSTFEWDTNVGSIVSGQGTATITVWAYGTAGNYYVNLTETDQNGCSGSADPLPVTIQENPTPDIGSPNGDVACENETITYETMNNGNSYTWTVSAGGTIVSGQGTASIDIEWENNGDFVVSVTETNSYGCTGMNSNTITVFDAPDPEISGAAETCVNATDVTYSVTSTPSNSYTWGVNGGQITSGTYTNEITVDWGSSSGTYSVVLYENNAQCTSYTYMDVVLNEGIDPVISGNDRLCNEATGYYSVEEQSGNSYTWTISEGGSFYSGENSSSCEIAWNSSGTHTVSVTVVNQYGCEGTDQFTVIIDPLPQPEITGAATVCSGHLYTYESNTSEGIDYQWVAFGGTIDGSSTMTTVDVSWDNVSSGELMLVQTNPTTNCEGYATLAVAINPSPSVTAGDDAAICYGSSVELTGSASGGTQPYTYYWEPSTGLSDQDVANPIASPTQSTTYTLYLADGVGCQAHDQVVVTVYPEITLNAGEDADLCYGGSTQLEAMASGGTGTLAYSWTPSTGLSDASVYNPTASPTETTTYTVTVTDQNDCSMNDEIVVNVNQAMDLSVNAENNFLCYGSSTRISSTISGGTPGYTYSWSPSEGLTSTDMATTTASPTESTTYTLTVTDDMGCTIYESVEIDVNPELNISADDTDEFLCYGTTTQLYTTTTGGTPGYTYTWSPSMGLSATDVASPTASPTESTSYTVIVTDAAGCKAEENITVSVNPEITLTMPDDAFICYGSSVELNTTASGGTGDLTYSWSPSTGLSATDVASPIASPTETSYYTLTVEDELGCTIEKSVTVEVNPELSISANSSEFICYGSSVELTTTTTGGTPDYTYSWSPTTGLSDETVASPTAMPTETTQYTVTVTDASGCTAETTVTVEVNPEISLTMPDDPFLCYGESVQLSPEASGGSGLFSYSWTPSTGLSATDVANPTANPTETTEYTLTVMDGAGCTATETVLVEVNPELSISANSSEFICYGSSVELTTTTTGGTPDYTYSWSPTTGLSDETAASPTAMPTETTQYTVTVTDAAGCTAETTVTVEVNPEITVDAGSDVEICYGESIGLNAQIGGGTGELTYSWTPSTGLSATDVLDPTANPAETTEYTLTVTDAAGCTATDMVTVTVRPLPEPAIAGETTVCENTANHEYSTEENAGSSYEWTVTGGTITDGAGTSSITVEWGNAGEGYLIVYETTEYGCRASAEAMIAIMPSPQPEITSEMPVVCKNTYGIYTTEDHSGSTYSWQTIGGEVLFDDGNTVTIQWPEAGEYTIYVTETSEYGCEKTDEFNVTVLELPDVAITGDKVVCFGDLFQYSATEDPDYTYEWLVSGGEVVGPDDGSTVTVNWDEPGEAYINVIVVDENGCSNSEEIMVTINPSPAPEVAGEKQVCENAEGKKYVTEYHSGSSYSWDVTGGTIVSGQNSSEIIVDWGAPGLGVIELTEVNKYGCSTEYEYVVKISPEPDTEIEGETQVCVGDVATYEAGNNPGYEYSWDVSGGTAIGGTNEPELTVSWANQGDGVVAVTITHEITGCNASAELDVTVNPNPDPQITGAEAVCINSVETYSSPTPDGALNKWTAVGGNIVGADDGPDVEIEWNSEGAGVVSLHQVMAETGCEASTDLAVEVSPQPDVTIESIPEFCENDPPYTLVEGNPDGGVFEGPGISGNVFVPGEAGAGLHEITYTYTNENGCSNSASAVIRVWPQPEKPDITLNDINQLTSSADDGNQWYFEGDAIEGANEKEYTAWETGNYTVQVTNEHGCVSEMSDPVYVDLTSVDWDELSDGNIEIYPNPAGEYLYVEFAEASSGAVDIRLINLIGKTVFETAKPHASAGYVEKIDISRLQSGVYILQIADGQNNYRLKVIVSH